MQSESTWSEALPCLADVFNVSGNLFVSFILSANIDNMPRKTPTDLNSPSFLFLATLVSVALWFIPYYWIAVYPWRLFVTFVHEGGHVLATLLTGGEVERMEIYFDASGDTYSRGGIPLLIASAGYLSSSACGAMLLAASRRGDQSRRILTISAIIILVLTAVFTHNTFSLIAGFAMTCLLSFAVISASMKITCFLANFLAVQCCLNAFFDLRTLYRISATGQPSDAETMERLTFIPAVFWAGFWIVLSLFLLLVGLRRYVRNGRG
jgi:hypothetical protein